MKLECKINLTNYTENEKLNPAMLAQSFGENPVELYHNAILVHKECVRDMLNGGYGSELVRYDATKKTYRTRVYQWTCNDGHVVRACAGKKSEQRVRDWIAGHDKLFDVLSDMGYVVSESDFVELFNEQLEKIVKPDSGYTGYFGVAFELTLKAILTPHSRWKNRATPQGKIDISKRWTDDEKRVLLEYALID